MESQRKGFSMCLISARVGNIEDRTGTTVGGGDEVGGKGLTIGVYCGYTHLYCLFNLCGNRDQN